MLWMSIKKYLIENINHSIIKIIQKYFFNKTSLIPNIKFSSFDIKNIIEKVNEEYKEKDKENKEQKEKFIIEERAALLQIFIVLTIIFIIVLTLIFFNMENKNMQNIISWSSLFLMILSAIICVIRQNINNSMREEINERFIRKTQRIEYILFNDQIKPVILNYYENVENEIIRKIRNDYVDKIHIFKYETKNKIDRIDNVPKQISNSLNIFDFDFIRESCKYADTIDAKEEYINKYLNLRQSYIQKEIYTKLDRETKKLTKEYFTFIQEYLLEMNIEGGISKRIMEEALKETFKTNDINLAVKKDDNIINLDTATNVVIGAGSILAGTLIASNPAGWIFGAAVGGFILAGQADKIKVLLKKIGIGINSKRVEEKIKNIEQAIKDNTIKSLEPACNELKNNLFLINDKIRDNLLSELEDYIKPKLQIED